MQGLFTTMIIDGRSLNALVTDSSAPAELDKIVRPHSSRGKDGAVNVREAPASLVRARRAGPLAYRECDSFPDKAKAVSVTPEGTTTHWTPSSI